MLDKDICYPILLFKIDGVDTPRETVMRHIAYVKSLDDAGKLVLAGPFENFAGGMVIVRADSIEAATEIAKSDPFVTEGVRTFEIRKWLLANRANGYLG
jgi:uncharacterized protein YciI